ADDSLTARRRRPSWLCAGRAGSSTDPDSGSGRTSSSSGRSFRCVGRADPGEPLLEVPDQIVEGFDTNREPDGPRTYTRRAKLIVVQLPMCRAGWMDDEALGIADVRKVRPQGHAAYEVLS